MSTPTPDIASDALTLFSYFGTLIGAGVAAFLGYKLKKVPAVQHDAVITGIGTEFGNRQQQVEMNEHLKSISESLRVLADRKQAAFEEKVMDALDRMGERERRP